MLQTTGLPLKALVCQSSIDACTCADAGFAATGKKKTVSDQCERVTGMRDGQKGGGLPFTSGAEGLLAADEGRVLRRVGEGGRARVHQVACAQPTKDKAGKADPAGQLLCVVDSARVRSKDGCAGVQRGYRGGKGVGRC
eukprot:4193962-Pleurochrysis_carterae.AAC.2